MTTDEENVKLATTPSGGAPLGATIGWRVWEEATLPPSEREEELALSAALQGRDERTTRR